MKLVYALAMVLPASTLATTDGRTKRNLRQIRENGGKPPSADIRQLLVDTDESMSMAATFGIEGSRTSSKSAKAGSPCIPLHASQNNINAKTSVFGGSFKFGAPATCADVGGGFDLCLG